MINENIDRIATTAKTKEIVSKYDFFLKKNFGQNFLIDQHVISKIINSAEITKDDLVIEIGPGIGGLTQELLERAGKVISIEIDKNLIPILNEELKAYDNLTIINEDVLKVSIPDIIKESGYKKAKIVANLPYYITTPIIMTLLENHAPVESIIVMIQKEVATRMSAKVGSKDYGSLSIVVNCYADAYLVANVPNNCFMPRPNVDSCVIKLTLFDKSPIDVIDEKFFFRIVKAGFSMRRKTLVNCLFSLEEIPYTKVELEEILVSIGIDAKKRGETLSIFDYEVLSNTLYKKLKNI